MIKGYSNLIYVLGAFFCSQYSLASDYIFSTDVMIGNAFSGTYNLILGGRFGFTLNQAYYLGVTYNHLIGANQANTANIGNQTGSVISGANLVTGDVGYRIKLPYLIEVMPYIGIGTLEQDVYTYSSANGSLTSAQTTASFNFLTTIGAHLNYEILPWLAAGLDNRFTLGPTSFQYLLSATVGIRI